MTACPPPTRQRTLALIDLGVRVAPYFAALSPHLLPQWRTVHFSLRPLVRSLLRQMRLPVSPRDSHLLLPTHADLNLLADAGEKAQQVYRDHGLLARRVAALSRALVAFFDAERVDAIFVWNGSGLCASVAAAEARRRGLQLLFGENGYLPGTLQLDTEGVNWRASVTRVVAENRDHPPADPQAEARLDAAIADFVAGRRRPERPAPSHLLASTAVRFARELQRLTRRRAWLPGIDLARRGFVRRIEPLPERFVFLPFQVAADSQLLLHSPLVGGDMVRLLEVVHAALQKVAPAMRLVVKLHPAERHHVLHRYRELPSRFADVLFCHEHPSRELLLACSAVVTVNSTAGFEGIVCGKPVVALGRNFYTAPGLVQVVQQLSALPEALRDALQHAPDTARRRRFLLYIHDQFLANVSYRDFSALSFAATASRMRSLLATTGAQSPA